MLTFIYFHGIRIPMYGLLIVIGAALGVISAILLNRHKNVPGQDIFFACCYAGVGIFIGAKLLYLAITLPKLMNASITPALSIELIFQLFSYGFIFYGGAFGGLLGVYIYAKKFGIHFLTLIEILTPSIPLVHAVGRIGCFCAGCCYGFPTDSSLGVIFRADSMAPQGITLFPVQLLESALNFILYLALVIFSRKERRPRQLIGLYFTCYGLERFLLEFLRYDAARGIFGGLSTSQWISLAIIPIGSYMLFRSRRSLEKEAPLL